MKKVWVHWENVKEACEMYKGDIELVYGKEIEILKDVDGIILGSLKMSAELMDFAGEKLKIIARPGIGLDTVDIPAATERGIAVVYTPNAPTESTAEHTVALLMALSKRIIETNRLMTEGIWNPLKNTEMKGKTVGIVGLGRIGCRVAEILKNGLGMDIAGYDPYVDNNVIKKYAIKKYDLFDAMLPDIDFLCINAPYTRETHHLLNAKNLSLLSEKAYIINCGRGCIIDEEALYAALSEGKIAGAALDVFEKEPVDKDFKLTGLRNVICTPHCSSTTDVAIHNMGKGVMTQIIDFFQGRTPEFLVNENKGVKK